MARGGRLSPGFTARLNLLSDIAIVVGATIVASGWEWGMPLGELPAAVFWVAVSLASVWVIAAAALRHYVASAYERGLIDEVAMVTTQAAAALTVLVLIDLFAGNAPGMPRPSVFLVVVWCLSLPLRLGLFRQIAAREEPTDDVLIVGTGPIARLTAQDLRNHGRRRVVGHLRLLNENGKEGNLLYRSYAADGAECRVLGTGRNLESVLRTVAVDEVYIAADTRKHGDEMQDAIRICEKLGISFALPAYAFRLDRAQAVNGRAVADGYLHYQNFSAEPYQVAIERLFDIAASAFALWLLLPIFLATIVAIKLTSRGPVFFRQARVGMHGRRFNMLKFRSMVANAEALKATLANLNEQSGPVFKMRRDPRVTRVGRFIRKYSIDELPQLINVLRGDMSVVGPRPPVPDEVMRYEAWQQRRLSARPGLTCIWQVSGRNQISFEQWMYLDMQYIDHWSLRGDFNLIFRTVPVVLTGRGAS